MSAIINVKNQLKMYTHVMQSPYVDYVYAHSGSDEHIDFNAKHIPQAKVLRSEDRKVYCTN